MLMGALEGADPFIIESVGTRSTDTRVLLYLHIFNNTVIAFHRKLVGGEVNLQPSWSLSGFGFFAAAFC